MYHWLTKALTGKSQMNTKAVSEMLIRQGLDTLTSLVKEYNLLINVALIKSNQIRADVLTSVSRRWLNDV